MVSAWSQFLADMSDADCALAAAEGGTAFAFVEGAMVKAVRDGDWLLLDEVRGEWVMMRLWSAWVLHLIIIVIT